MPSIPASAPPAEVASGLRRLRRHLAGMPPRLGTLIAGARDRGSRVELPAT